MADQPDSKFSLIDSIKSNSGLLLLTAALVAVVLALRSFNYPSLSTEDYVANDGFKMLGILFLVALIVERAVEAFINVWRMEKKKQLENEVKERKLKAKDTARDAAVVMSAQNQLSTYKSQTQKLAIISSFIMGLMVSVSGYNILETFFQTQTVGNDVVQTTLKGATNNITALIRDSELESRLIYFKENDTTYNRQDSLSIKLSDEFATIDSLLEASFSISNVQKQKSINFQSDLFGLIGIFLTALLISGGSEVIHKIFAVYSAFMDNTKARAEGQSP